MQNDKPCVKTLVRDPYRALWADVIVRAVDDIRKLKYDKWCRGIRGSNKVLGDDQLSAVQFIFSDEYRILDGTPSTEIFDLFPEVELEAARDHLYKEMQGCERFVHILETHCLDWYSKKAQNVLARTSG
jgi:hypothetical protein